MSGTPIFNIDAIKQRKQKVLDDRIRIETLKLTQDANKIPTGKDVLTLADSTLSFVEDVYEVIEATCQQINDLTTILTRLNQPYVTSEINSLPKRFSEVDSRITSLVVKTEGLHTLINEIKATLEASKTQPTTTQATLTPEQLKQARIQWQKDIKKALS